MLTIRVNRFRLRALMIAVSVVALVLGTGRFTASPTGNGRLYVGQWGPAFVAVHHTPRWACWLMVGWDQEAARKTQQ